jgi:hypothetical protein
MVIDYKYSTDPLALWPSCWWRNGIDPIYFLFWWTRSGISSIDGNTCTMVVGGCYEERVGERETERRKRSSYICVQLIF